MWENELIVICLREMVIIIGLFDLFYCLKEQEHSIEIIRQG